MMSEEKLNSRPMREEYTSVLEVYAKEFFCPYLKKSCIASKCMAWVRSVDEKGYPVYRGRCGMVNGVQPVYRPLYTYICPSEEEYEENKRIEAEQK